MTIIFYGKESIKIEKNRITVTIPFNIINVNTFEIVSDKVYHKVTNKTEDIIGELKYKLKTRHFENIGG